MHSKAETEREKKRERQSENAHTAFDCVKLYVMPPTASAPGTVLNRHPSTPYPDPSPCQLSSHRQIHMLIHSRIHTAIHPWPARSFPCTVQRRVSLDIYQRRGRASRERERGKRGASGSILTRPQSCRTSGCFNRVRGQSQEHKALQSTAHFSDNY